MEFFLSRNFVGAIRTTTTNCKVSFIDLYLVFHTNFRIVFLPHTNTVILGEPYCGTITEPGLPVLTLALPRRELNNCSLARVAHEVIRRTPSHDDIVRTKMKLRKFKFPET